MHLEVHPYNLKFKHPFAIAHGMRYHTEALYVEAHVNNVVGYGEATFPPYLPYKRDECMHLLKKCKFNFNTETFWLHGFDTDLLLPPPANAALSMALFDVYGKVLKQPICQMLQMTSVPVATYTIGICGLDELQLRLHEAADFKLLKIKLDGKSDINYIKAIKKLTKQPFCVDANQAWTQLSTAQYMIDFLYDMGCTFIEQPLPVNMHQLQADLYKKCKLPLIADESCQTCDDLKHIKDRFHGINIKLMKCGGIHQALQLIQMANENYLSVMIGCMSEGSVGCSAAAQLAGFAQTVDLDGPLLNSNDPFTGITYQDGIIKLNRNFGIGVTPNHLYTR